MFKKNELFLIIEHDMITINDKILGYLEHELYQCFNILKIYYIIFLKLNGFSTSVPCLTSIYYKKKMI